MASEPESFGCVHCYPVDAEAAWSAWPEGWVELVRLVDESHFSVNIHACRACGQRFVKVFTEVVDLMEGDDAQCWSVMPLTHGEVDLLTASDADVEGLLARTGQGRRGLEADHPTRASKRVTWILGPLWIGFHD